MEIINRLFRGLIVGCMVLAQSQAYALPSGEAVVPGSGSATIAIINSRWDLSSQRTLKLKTSSAVPMATGMTST